VHALLTLARAQTDDQAVKLEPVELASLLSAVDHDSSGTLAIECPRGLAALAQPQMLHQALGNLVENAVTHGAGGDVTLRAQASGGDRVRVEVTDSGPGMSESEAANALSRFYRGDSAADTAWGFPSFSSL
jgi:signal transduction histidine kinase